MFELPVKRTLTLAAACLSAAAMVGCADDTVDQADLDEAKKQLGTALRENSIISACADPLLPEGEVEDPESRESRMELCDLQTKREEDERVREVQQQKALAAQQQNVDMSREWRERRSLQDPDQFAELQEQCESSVSIKRDDDRRLIQVTDCMRLSWK